MAKIKICKLCAQGNRPRDDGNHWIVQSIFPAKIKIAKCSSPSNGSPEHQSDASTSKPAIVQS